LAHSLVDLEALRGCTWGRWIVGLVVVWDRYCPRGASWRWSFGRLAGEQAWPSLPSKSVGRPAAPAVGFLGSKSLRTAEVSPVDDVEREIVPVAAARQLDPAQAPVVACGHACSAASELCALEILSDGRGGCDHVRRAAVWSCWDWETERSFLAAQARETTWLSGCPATKQIRPRD